MNSSTLLVNAQGTMSALNYPQFRVEGTSRWIILECAVFKFYVEGGHCEWFDDDPHFRQNLNYALNLPTSCNRSDAGERVIQEIAVLTQLLKNI